MMSSILFPDRENCTVPSFIQFGSFFPESIAIDPTLIGAGEKAVDCVYSLSIIDDSISASFHTFVSLLILSTRCMDPVEVSIIFFIAIRSSSSFCFDAFSDSRDCSCTMLSIYL